MIFSFVRDNLKGIVFHRGASCRSVMESQFKINIQLYHGMLMVLLSTLVFVAMLECCGKQLVMLAQVLIEITPNVSMAFVFLYRSRHVKSKRSSSKKYSAFIQSAASSASLLYCHVILGLHISH